MSFIDSLNLCIEILYSSSHVILSTHINPDGDALGSTLALYHWLSNRGIKTDILIDGVVPSNLKFLPGSENIKTFDPKKHNKLFKLADTIVILDLNDSKRLRALEMNVLTSGARKILIDHHINPKDFVDLYVVDTEAAATSELLYRIFDKAKSTFTKEMAIGLYTGIATDTGNFRFNRTDAELLHMASKLIEYGADPVDIYEQVYNQNSFNAVRLLGMAIANMELHYDNRMCVMKVSNYMFESTNSVEDDVENFVEKTMSIEGVCVGVLITEVKERNEARVSFRSKGDIPVRKLAEIFNGGGHLNAAGARIHNLPFDEVVSKVIEEAHILF